MLSTRPEIREIINMFLFSQVFWLLENFKIGIFSDTINVMNVKLCMMLLLSELYLLHHFQSP